MAGAVEAFAEEVGDTGPVTCVGGRTQWTVGGSVVSEARPVRAPSGVVSFDPAEMTVRVRAGTTVEELDAVLTEGGQMVPLDPLCPSDATVGGVLAVGHSGLRRLRYGPVRDTVLEVRFVDAGGRVVKAGGPVVKNVTGFDLCRVLVGSLGTLGFIAEVVLRAQPRPACRVWLVGDDDPFAARRRLFRPSSILWNGERTWVLLEGMAEDVADERRALGEGFTETAGPPAVGPLPHRWSVAPAQLAALEGPFLAEVGVGTVHRADPPPPVDVEARVLDLNERLKATFDPQSRLNPGRSVLP